MNEREVVAKFFALRPEFALQSNVSFLRDHVAEPITVESLNAAADQFRDTLALANPYDAAWLDWCALNPNKRGLAYRRQLVEGMREKEIQAAATKEYESLIKQVGERFRGESIERLREVAEKRRVNNLTASQFKQERAASAPKVPQRQYDGFPIMPDFLVLPGSVQATKIDAAFLSGLVRADYYLYRRLASKYGMDQITDRQNGISK
jgi:hypothetical protein